MLSNSPITIAKATVSINCHDEVTQAGLVKCLYHINTYMLLSQPLEDCSTQNVDQRDSETVLCGEQRANERVKEDRAGSRQKQGVQLHERRPD